MAFKVVTFGEIMLRLSPPGYKRFKATSFDAVYGGAKLTWQCLLLITGLMHIL